MQSTIQPVKPVATVNAGGVWESINGGLSDALNLWGKVEQIKGQKSASGADQTQAMYQPPMANGAAVQIDQQLNQQANKNQGVQINKPLLFASAGVLVIALLMHKAGW